MATLETLVFDNAALRSLPVEDSSDYTPHIVHNACFSRLQPTPVVNPCTVAYSVPALQLLDLSETEAKRPQFAEYFSGNKLLPGSDTAAHCYCGYQFGTFAGQLGDGAAMYLGEVVNSAGERWEVQLKGAGLTPYSRTADGRKVLRSSVREFLCSEAMYHLGIATTRAGSCIVSDSTVTRDIFRDDNPVTERCCVVLRIAPTFIRFGSFEIFNGVDVKTGRQGPSYGRRDILQQLTIYVISSFYPEIWAESKGSLQSAVKAFFKEVVTRTARLVAQWQCVGWCHGGPNTDNTSIVGLTLDYGPFGFQDKFQRDFVSNTSDYGGRYNYSQQPAMLKWNCVKLAEALQPLVDTCDLRDIVCVFDEEFTSAYLTIMSKKFGFIGRPQSSDRELMEAFLTVLEVTGADFTNCFRSLSRVPLLVDASDYERRREQWLDHFLSQCATAAEMQVIHRSRTDPSKLDMIAMLLKKDEDFANRLGLNSEVLERERTKQELLRAQPAQVVTEAEKRAADRQVVCQWLHSYTHRLLADREIDHSDRVKVMNNTNPRYILRTYMAQTAIEAAEAGDFSEVRTLLALLQHPYSDHADGDTAGDTSPSHTCHQMPGVNSSAYDMKPPGWAAQLKVS